MTYTEIDLDNIPLMIERERLDYKAKLGGKGATRHAEPKTLDFILPGDRQLKVVLHYISMDSPTGFPFHRLTCKLQLDGKRISNAKLAELCTSTHTEANQ